MRKLKIILLACLSLVSVDSYSQFFKFTKEKQSKHDYSQYFNDKGQVRSRYVNLSLVKTKLEQDNFPQLKSNYGVGLTIGKTFYLPPHTKPIANLMRFGIDVSFLDLNYTNYRIEHTAYGITSEYDFHQGEASIQVGPSLTLTPVKNLNIVGYFRYAPTYSGIYANENYSNSYASMFVGGASVSYKAIGLGVESRFGNAKHDAFFFDDDSQNTERLKTSFNGYRAYITIRF